MHRAAPLLLVALLPGCEFFRKAQDTFEGLTNPLVGLGIVLGVQPASTGGVDLSGTGFEEGTALTVMLADAASATDIENAPVEGADVACNGEAADEIDVGVYAIQPGALTWEDGAVWDITVGIGEDTATASVTLPPAATWTPPPVQHPNTDLTVDLTGQDYDAVLVIVADQDGNITYSNQPDDAKEVYDFTHGDAELSVTVPGTVAFPSEGGYLIGVAGTRHTGASDLDEMNTALSTIVAGKMIVHPIVVTP